MMAETGTTARLQIRPHGDRACLTFSGRLSRSPVAGSLCPGELEGLPLLDIADYAALSQVEEARPQAPPPVLMSTSQRYRLLTELLATTRRYVPAMSLALIAHQAAHYLIPLPAELLAEDVILTDHPSRLVRRLMAAGRSNILTIEDDIRCDGYDDGENRISIALHDAENASQFVAFLHATPLLECVTEVTLTYTDPRSRWRGVLTPPGWRTDPALEIGGLERRPSGRSQVGAPQPLRIERGRQRPIYAMAWAQEPFDEQAS